MTKKLIEKDVAWLYDLGGSTLPEAIKQLQEAMERHGEDAKLVIETVYDSIECKIEAMVLESDEEYNKRLQQEERAKKFREEFEREQYLKLKEKFGGL
jgi:hypothetical protein